MKYRRLHFPVALACLVLRMPMAGQTSRSTTLAVTVAPQCSVSITSQTQSDPGQGKTQTISFGYKIRTSSPRGSGQITAQFATQGSKNFPNGSKVDYQTTLNGPGVPSSGTVPTSKARASGIVIATFGANAASGRNGASGSFQFTVNPAPVSPFQPLQASLSIGCQ